MPKPAEYAKLFAYSLGQVVTSPLAGVRQAVRYLHPKIHQQIVVEAWTLPMLTPEATAKCLEEDVFHVAFVGPTIGEFRQMSALGDEIARLRPDVRVTYCLRDPLSVERIRNDRPELSVGFRPVDFLPITARWMRRYRPDAVVFVEGMRFPALAWTAHLAGSANVLVNGRCSIRQKLHHRLRAPFFRWLFAPFSTLLFQSERDVDNALKWTEPNQRVLATGNLKTALPPKAHSSDLVEDLGRWIGPGAPVLAAGSTADVEEEGMVLDTFERLAKDSPCRLLIAPRQLGRVAECVAEVQRRGLRISSRTRPVPSAQVFVLDTLGELETAYSLCVAAYVGGSFRGEGHNVLEPVGAGVPVSYGPRRGAFEEAQTLCENAGVGTRIFDPSDIFPHWERVLGESEYREEVSHRAKELLAERSQPFTATVAELLRLIDAH